MMERLARPVLEIDLDAIAANWRLLARKSGAAETAAVVKADAYGTGAAMVGPRLWREGARTFFVATAEEALALRAVLADARIYCLGGFASASAAPLVEASIRPVLNGPEDVARHAGLARARGVKLEAALHLDTGMTRLGLDPADDAQIPQDDLAALDLELVMSHLVSAEEADDPLNDRQRDAFDRRRRRFSATRSSLANSSGHFLGEGFFFDLTRPGVALYGANPTPGRPNPMRAALRLRAPILQIHEVDAPGSVGYGATHGTKPGDIIATVGVGYADGYPRSAGGRSRARIAGVEVPVVGRVSMDLVTLDASAVPREALDVGAPVELLGADYGVDDLAAAADTIGYEVLTRLGRRYARRYCEAAPA